MADSEISSSAPESTNSPDEECVSVIADTHFEAVRKIQAEIGLDALVVNSRQIPASGLGRLWKKPKVELTVKPKQTPTKILEAPMPQSLPEAQNVPLRRAPLLNIYDEGTSETTEELAIEKRSPILHATAQPNAKTPSPHSFPKRESQDSAEKRCESFLRKIGLDELIIAKICDEAALEFQKRPVVKNRELLDFCRTRFGQIWQSPKSAFHAEDRPIVLLGAPGAGKTTLIGKWISLLSLKTELTTRIWKLDGLRANTDEFLDLIAELHHIPIHRVPQSRPGEDTKELLFIDIPGVDWNDPTQLQSLEAEIAKLPAPNLYLVLNAAYDNDILKRQIRAYARFPISGLILTHLDEEKRWSKILNVTIGTNYPLRIVSGGQNIPGYFQAAGSEEILSHIFPTES